MPLVTGRYVYFVVRGFAKGTVPAQCVYKKTFDDVAVARATRENLKDSNPQNRYYINAEEVKVVEYGCNHRKRIERNNWYVKVQ